MECPAVSGAFSLTHKNSAFRHETLVFMTELGDSLETCRKDRKSDDVIAEEIFSLFVSAVV
jgi:hypothetical protein